MQNKPNFPDAKMNLTTYGHKDYQNTHPHSPLQNKPNFTPTPNSTQPTIKMQNKPNLRNAKVNLTSYSNKDYENMRLRGPCQNKPNQPQFRTNRLDKHKIHPLVGTGLKTIAIERLISYSGVTAAFFCLIWY